MFIADDSPARVVATPQLQAHLEQLAARSGDITILLTDEQVKVVAPDEGLPVGTVHLGHIDEAGQVSCFAVGDGQTTWWRNRAQIDVTDSTLTRTGGPALSFVLSPLTEAEIYAAVASGPLPRY